MLQGAWTPWVATDTSHNSMMNESARPCTSMARTVLAFNEQILEFSSVPGDVFSMVCVFARSAINCLAQSCCSHLDLFSCDEQVHLGLGPFQRFCVRAFLV